MMRLKDAKEAYKISSTYYYKLKNLATGDENKFETLLKEYQQRKEARIEKLRNGKNK